MRSKVFDTFVTHEKFRKGQSEEKSSYLSKRHKDESKLNQPKSASSSKAKLYFMNFFNCHQLDHKLTDCKMKGFGSGSMRV